MCSPQFPPIETCLFSSVHWRLYCRESLDAEPLISLSSLTRPVARYVDYRYRVEWFYTGDYPTRERPMATWEDVPSQLLLPDRDMAYDPDKSSIVNRWTGEMLYDVRR